MCVCGGGGVWVCGVWCVGVWVCARACVEGVQGRKFTSWDSNVKSEKHILI